MPNKRVKSNVAIKTKYSIATICRLLCVHYISILHELLFLFLFLFFYMDPGGLG